MVLAELDDEAEPFTIAEVSFFLYFVRIKGDKCIATCSLSELRYIFRHGLFFPNIHVLAAIISSRGW